MLEILKSMWPLILLVAFMAALATILRLLGINLKSPRSRRRNPNMIDPVVDALFDAGVSKTIEFPYRRIDSLLSRGEQAFYRSLLIAVGTRCTIMAKVRVADILHIEDAQNSQAAFNRISAKHVDFVLCELETTRILAAVELDDVSHTRSDRIDRDDFLDQALGAANLPLIRIKAAPTYNANEITRLIESRLGRVSTART